MEKTYLVEILSKLSSRQMKELGDFVNSPFFNKNESTVKLYGYLFSQHPQLKPELIDKQFVYKKLFGANEYNDGLMRNMIFRLTELTEQYLAYSDMKQDEGSHRSHLIQSLLDLGIERGAQRMINTAEKEISRRKIKSSRYFYDKYRLDEFRHIIYSRNFNAVTIKDKPDERMMDASNNFTSYSLLVLFKRFRYLLNKGFTVNSDFELNLLPYLIKFIEGEGKEHLEVKELSLLYREILLLLDSSREDLLFELKDELQDNKLPIEDGERREGLTVLINICIEKAYAGRNEFYKYLFDMNKYLISKDLYRRVEGGYFETESFANAVTLGLTEGDLKWTKEFIENNFKKLAPDQQENIYNISYAKFYLRADDFSEAQNYIRKVSLTGLYFKINARLISIMIQYELGNIEEAMTEIENYRKYVQNDKLLNSSHKRILSNFIKFMLQICKARFNPKTNLQKLKDDISECDQVASRRWLKEKAEELLHRKG
ncbi:MAG: hypothetical protein IAE90_04865 [Ignavibacteria bacterium]|nr:hypothetical protein [Ignavibacteria bacterium]